MCFYCVILTWLRTPLLHILWLCDEIFTPKTETTTIKRVTHSASSNRNHFHIMVSRRHSLPTCLWFWQNHPPLIDLIFHDPVVCATVYGRLLCRSLPASTAVHSCILHTLPPFYPQSYAAGANWVTAFLVIEASTCVIFNFEGFLLLFLLFVYQEQLSLTLLADNSAANIGLLYVEDQDLCVSYYLLFTSICKDH